jgi:MFS family permease
VVAIRPLGRQFGWLWAAYAVSSFGTWLAFDAFALIAIIVLHSGPAQVSALAAAGRVVGAAVAVPLGPWVEFRRKRPGMVAMDLIRFAAVMSIPAAFALGWLSFTQLLIVSVIVAAADIVFRAASGAYLKALVRPADLLVANGRFESTTWTATALGPPLGGALISMFGPVTTVVVDAVSYLFSAIGISAIHGREPLPKRTDALRLRAGDLLDGWRYILTHRTLRPLFFNTTLVNGLIMATSPLIAVLMLGHLGFKDRANRPHPVCVVGDQQRDHCYADCSVGSVCQHHRSPHSDRGCRCPPARDAFPPPSTRRRAAARSGFDPEPHVIFMRLPRPRDFAPTA